MNSCVFEFSDGTLFEIFNADASELENQRLAAAVAAEGRRRAKAGLQHRGFIRERLPQDVVVSELHQQLRKESA
ncbi:MAG TPA: hypothetical protein VEJ63_05715 [Planctomycetota bacterium]|nr:hypothetical protein [Planctomycetota bacterium]